jgi:serine/threonine-protein kinase
VGLHGNDTDATEATVFGPYRLQGLLGRGGMGEVYRAFDTGRDRVVALKVLPSRLAGDADFAARFRREARLAARLRDPHVVPIHDYGEVDGRLFLDMRLVEGTDLAAVLTAERRLDPARAVHLVAQVAGALDAAHRDGLVHRDVKPSNVLVTADQHVYLTDFGIARSTDATALTGTGAAVGTIHYMAPERFLLGRVDRRVDVYSLGCLLHEALTGRRPYPGDEIAAQMYAHVHLPVPRPSALVPGLPAALDAVVARAMAKDPAHRFDTAGALAGAARAALTATAADPRAHPGDTLHATTPLGPGTTTGPGDAPRNPWRRRAFAAGGVAAASLVAAGVAVAALVTQPPAAGPVAAAGPAAPATAAAPPPAPTSPAPDPGASAPVVPVGQAVRDGGVEITVTAARSADAVDIGNDYSGYVPTPAGRDARYVVVEATVRNDTARSISPGCGGGVSTAVLDDRDRRFDPITQTSQLRGNTAACFPALQPGFTVPVTWAFTVPARAHVTRFAFRDRSTSALPDATSPGVALDL